MNQIKSAYALHIVQLSVMQPIRFWYYPTLSISEEIHLHLTLRNLGWLLNVTPVRQPESETLWYKKSLSLHPENNVDNRKDRHYGWLCYAAMYIETLCWHSHCTDKHILYSVLFFFRWKSPCQSARTVQWNSPHRTKLLLSSGFYSPSHYFSPHISHATSWTHVISSQIVSKVRKNKNLQEAY